MISPYGRNPAQPINMQIARYEVEIDLYEGILRRHPGYIEVIEILGGLYAKQGMLDEGLKMDRRLVRLMPSNPTAHYNLACSLALKRRKADAIRALRQAVDLGYEDYRWLRDDPDLDCLRPHPAYQELLEAVRQRATS